MAYVHDQHMTHEERTSAYQTTDQYQYHDKVCVRASHRPSSRVVARGGARLPRIWHPHILTPTVPVYSQSSPSPTFHFALHALRASRTPHVALAHATLLPPRTLSQRSFLSLPPSRLSPPWLYAWTAQLGSPRRLRGHGCEEPRAAHLSQSACLTASLVARQACKRAASGDAGTLPLAGRRVSLRSTSSDSRPTPSSEVPSILLLTSSRIANDSLSLRAGEWLMRRR